MSTKRRSEDAPEYSSRYQEQIDALAGELLTRAPFTYDHSADPLWQAYRKEYVREGDRARADTLGQYAARTGGSPSTAAVTAAQQAGDYYAAKLSDRLPELYRLAYSMYSDETAGKQKTLGELRALENADRDLWQAQLKQWNADRDYDYRQDRDAVADQRYADETAYKRSRDAVADERYADETAYKRSRDDIADERYADETAYKRSRDAVADERYADETAYKRSRDAVADERYADETAYKRSRDDIADERYADETAYKREQDAAKAQSAAQTSGSGGSAGFAASGPERWSAVEDWAETYGYDKAESYIREHYKELGYSSQSAALAGWENYLTERNAKRRQAALENPPWTIPDITESDRFRLYAPGEIAGPTRIMRNA